MSEISELKKPLWTYLRAGGQRALFLIAALAFQPLLASGGGSSLECDVLLRAALNRDPIAEQAILTRASPASVDPLKASKLASDVFLLQLKEGNAVVLRLADELSNPTFEDFASRLIRTVPGLATPAIRRLTGTEVRGYLPALRASGLNPRIRLSESDNSRPIATLATYFPLTLGKAYMNDRVAMDLRNEIRDLFRTRGNASMLERVTRRWNETPAELRRAVAEDLSKLLPSLSPENVTLAALVRHAKDPGTTRHEWQLEGLRLSAWERLPIGVRRQLSGYWALYTTLGIPDFHPWNWLIRANSGPEQVLGIDVAMKSSDFAAGRKELELNMQQSPLDGGSVTPQLLRVLLRDLSPEHVELLKSLNAPQLKELAAGAGYKLQDRELDGMLNRARAIVERAGLSR